MSDAKREGEKEKVYNEGGEGACSTREQAKKEKDEDGEYLRELRGRWLTFVALMTRFESIKHSHYGWVDMRQLESVFISSSMLTSSGVSNRGPLGCRQAMTGAERRERSSECNERH